MKRTKKELASIWAQKNNIAGENPWFDRHNVYYNLRVEQIISMAKYIQKKLEEQR